MRDCDIALTILSGTSAGPGICRKGRPAIDARTLSNLCRGCQASNKTLTVTVGITTFARRRRPHVRKEEPTESRLPNITRDCQIGMIPCGRKDVENGTARILPDNIKHLRIEPRESWPSTGIRFSVAVGGSLVALALPSVLGCSGNGHIGDSQVDNNERQQQKFVHKNSVYF
jgi:hypothetical protein